MSAGGSCSYSNDKHNWAIELLFSYYGIKDMARNCLFEPERSSQLNSKSFPKYMHVFSIYIHTPRNVTQQIQSNKHSQVLGSTDHILSITL